jgi:hypothetical protein
MPKLKQKIGAYLRTNFKIFKRQPEERLVQNLPINELTTTYHAVQEYKPPTAVSVIVQSDLVMRNKCNYGQTCQ